MPLAEYLTSVENTLPATPTSSTAAFIEYPSQPLSDVERDEFLRIIEDDSEPNDALRAAAARYKSRKL